MHKLINLTGIALPFVALGLGIALLWNRAVGPTELGILVVGYVLTGLGVTVGFHRLFTHRAFQTFRPVRYVFAVLGEMAVESDVVTWVADHRKHHQYSDQPGDPHSPHADYGDSIRDALRGLWHAHTGWLFLNAGRADKARYAKDILADKGLRAIARLFMPIVLVSLLIPDRRRLGADRRLVRSDHGPGLGRRRSHLPAPPRHVLDQLDLSFLGPAPVPLERRVAQRLVALLALVRRVLAQQPPRLPDLCLPRPEPARARSRRPLHPGPRAHRAGVEPGSRSRGIAGTQTPWCLLPVEPRRLQPFFLPRGGPLERALVRWVNRAAPVGVSTSLCLSPWEATPRRAHGPRVIWGAGCRGTGGIVGLRVEVFLRPRPD